MQKIFFDDTSLSVRAGFTLIELLLVLALVVISVAAIAPLAWNFAMQNDLDISATLAAQSLRRAQSLAMDMSHDSAWGVEFSGQQLTVFAGSGFAGRNSAYDETVNLPSRVGVVGSSEIVFGKLSGQPPAPENITFTDSLNQSRQITVSSAGAVSF